ncbi:MAG: MCE family protein [Bdellovibrionales bacterium]|nr:MCE family protein [Bdellovibrionales bacterium]
MDSSKKKEIHVGIFIAGGLALLLTSIMLVGGDRYLFRSTYQLRVQMDQVQGLVEGSNVSLSGITVGLVKSIKFRKDSKLDLTLEIDREFAHRLTEGSLASVKTQGALGDKYIYIEPGPPDAPRLKEDAYMTADLSGDIIDIIKEKGPQLTHLVDAIKEVHILLSDINKGERAGKIMSNLVSATENLNKLLVESRQAVQDVRGGQGDKQKLSAATQHLVNILEKIDEGKGTLGAIINDPTLHQKISSLLGEPPRNKFLKPLIRQSIQDQEKKDEN